MAQDTEKQIQQFKNRLKDLAERSYTQGVFTFTGFLGLSEQDLFWQEEAGLNYAGYSLGGGFPSAERVMIRFGSAEALGYEVPFPVVCIYIQPLGLKFAEELSHRDFLGALMSLGIERSTIGDIRVGAKQACLFCVESVAEFICDNLVQVKHTHVKCAVTENMVEIPEEEPILRSVQVQSLRVDAVLAKVCALSRVKSQELFQAGKVYVDGRLCLNCARQLKGGETVNARGFGKFVLTGEARETRKGKLSVDVAVYR